MSRPEVIVLFGASGDLARRLLFPALYRLEERRFLRQRIVGIALEEWDTAAFAEHVTTAVEAGIGEVDPDVMARLSSRLGYVAGDYTEGQTYRDLAAGIGAGKVCFHYLAIPPVMFETVVSGLADAGLLEGARLLVEKPFGRDLASARGLNDVLHRFVAEKAVYRIDHFLGKEPVENLLAFRYANPIFDAVWSRHYIDHIQITMAESFGVADRGALYESLGVVRDVVQNHLLQVVCLLTMEAPVNAEADAFADERAKVLKAVSAVDPAGVVYGQYDGYRSIRHVAPDSKVATYVAFSLSLDSPRWYGVPIYIRSGKALAVTATQAVVVFRESPPLPFSPEATRPESNELVFRIGPSDGVDLRIQTKRPGDGLGLVTTPLTVDYDTLFGRIPLAYERVMHDALEGDRSQFAREDAIEEAWRIVDGINDPGSRPPGYPEGSWGPDRAAAVPVDGRSWIDPTPGTDPV